MLDLQLPARHDWAGQEQHYGKLVMEPFEPGFALTVGIAYRRVLLSAIPGAAPTWVKIEHVLHEFSHLRVADFFVILMSITYAQVNNEKQAEYLKDIYASGTHLLSLINDILDLSKIEAGRMELELTDFDLPTAIDNALTLVRERAGRRSIALHQAVDQCLGQARGDERKIKQILLNILSNALKFTPDGGRIDVRANVVDSMAEISVTDTGVGIAPEDQEAVFEEFRQVGTSAAKQEGTGLGLALCRRFVELHGGRIRVQSEVGRGSTFTFTIPVRRGE